MNPDPNSITVMTPKIVRKTLGLKGGSFSFITIEHGSLLFKGETEDGILRLPLSMMGTFHNELLNNLFLYLSNNRQNGILSVTTGPFTKSVFFKKGRIVFGGSTDARDRIGNVLLKLGYLNEEQLEEVAEDDQGTRRFGVRAHDMGFITKEQLWNALKIQVVGISCSLVNFPVGTYFFLPDCVPLDSFSRFSFDPTRMLFEGLRRLDEDQRRIDQGDSNALELTPLQVLSALEDG